MPMERKRYELTAREQKYAFLGQGLAYFVFELKEQVQPELLCQAARQAVSLHPRYGTSLVLDDVFFLEEDPSWEQHPEGTVIAGGAGTCLWWISCTANKVIMNGSHALADGMSFMQFAATLFHLYFEKCGFSFSAAAAADLPANPEETTRHPREICPGLTGRAAGVPQFPPPSPLSGDYFSPEEQHSLHLLEIPESEVRRFAAESETSVFSVVACLLARTMQEAFHLHDGCISVRVPVDYRKTFNTYTDYNFSQGFSLCYRPKRMAQLPDALVETAFRSQLDLFTDRDQIISSLHKDFRRLQDLKENRVSFDSYFQYAPDAGGPQAQVHYTHLTKPGFSKELAAKFNRLYFVADANAAHIIQIGATSFNGMISLVINQHVAGGRFIDALKHALDKKGLVYSLREMCLEDIWIC